MAAITLVKDVLYRASTLLLDSNPQFTRWTELELVMWLNDAQRAIAKFLPGASSIIASMLLASGTRQSIAAIPPAKVILSDGTTPAAAIRAYMLLDVIRNMGVDGKSPGTPIRDIPRGVQDNIDPAWHSTPGAGSVDTYMYDPRMPTTFYVSPAINPAIATWVELMLAEVPIDIPTSGIPRYGSGGSDTTVISIADQYVDDLLNYIAARANMKDSEFANAEKAQMHAQMFIASINSQGQVMTGTNPNLTFLPFAGGTIGTAR